MQHDLQVLLGVLTGLGLAAACGFRVFVPLLIASIAVKAGMIDVSPGFAWLGSWPALAGFAVATAVEIAAYYVPGVDHLLDSIASPAAVVAGSVLAASFITDVDPWLRWTLAIIAGGGMAGIVQAATVGTRGASAITTFGLGNPVVATVELAGAGFVALLAVLVPLFAIVAVIGLATWLVRRRRRRMQSIASTA